MTDRAIRPYGLRLAVTESSATKWMAARPTFHHRDVASHG